MQKTFDLIVLGAGSGGLAAAKRAAKHGARVAIVEGDRVGGTCVIRGCVPKKLLVYASMYRDYINDSSSYGFNFNGVSFDSNALLENVRKEVDRLNNLHIDSLNKLGIEIFYGWGHFLTANSISIRGMNKRNEELVLEASYILIAVGGRPVLPKIKGVKLGWVSDDMFLLDKLPHEIVVVGGGFIACEFSCILNGLGVQVKQLVRGSNLLRGFDNDLTLVLQDHMKKMGIKILFETKPTSITGTQGDLEVSIDSDQIIKCDGLLFATGRKPFLEGLHLDKVGININDQKIIVDNNNTTNIPNIFAVGDVTDRFNLTPVAIDEGRAFADRLFANKTRCVNYNLVPSAVFSQPEIAAIGLTEDKAINLYGKNNIKVYKTSFKSMSHALPKSGAPCLLKLVVSLEDEKVLGCHMVGDYAAEIIQMASISIGMGACKADFNNAMALHPTVAEEFVTMI